jgi:hypothetical protein
MTHTEALESSAAERYTLSEMPPEEREAFEEHYFGCAECATDVAAAGLMRDGVRAGLLEAPKIRQFVPRDTGSVPSLARAGLAWWKSAALPWAVAATLAVIVGYQTILLRPPAAGGSARLEPQALAPVTLRPASRGAEPVVSLPPGGAAVTLAIDLTTGADREVRFELRRADAQDSAAVSSGTVAAPPDGSPLLLLVPTWALVSGQHYVLVVHSTVDGRILDEYRFVARSQ